MTVAVHSKPAFEMVVARWRLTQAEVRMLIADANGRDGISPGDAGPVGRRRMSLVVELEAGLRDLLGAAAASAWVRRPSRSFGGASPLRAMAEEAVLRALVRTLAGRLTVAHAPAAVGIAHRPTP